MALLQPKRLSDEENIVGISPKKIKLCNKNNGVLKKYKRKKMSLEDLFKRIIVPLSPLNNAFKEEKRKNLKIIVDANKKENGRLQVIKETVPSTQISKSCSISSTNTGTRSIINENKAVNDVVKVNKDVISTIHTSENCSHSSSTVERVVSAQENLSDPSKNNKLFVEGNLVWAKLTLKESYWPAIILKRETTGFSSCDENQCCVFWLKDNRLSKVPKKYIMDYASLVPKLTIKKNENIMKTEAIYESIDLYIERTFEVILTLPNNEKLPWLKKAIADPYSIKNIICKRRCDEQNRTSQDAIVSEDNSLNQYFKLIDQNRIKSNLSIPDHMWAFIKKIKSRNEEKDKENSDLERSKDPYNFCLVCSKYTENFHPLFNLKLCENCTATYLDNFFEYDVRKHKKRFCVICGTKNSDKYSNEGYIWVFCSSCIENYFQLPTSEITEHWICFLNDKCQCNGKKTKHNRGLLKVQKTWWNNLSQSYLEIRTDLNLYQEFSKVIYIIPGSTKSGTVNIDKLPVDIKATTKNYIDIYWKNKKLSIEIKHILSSIQENMIILLIGSAGDISEPWVDWDKNQFVPVKNLEHLFMQFYHIYSKINELSLRKQIKMQWIFECSAAIPAFTRKRNTRFLKFSPKIINIQKNKGDNSFRMIWTNIDETEEFFKNILNI